MGEIAVRLRVEIVVRLRVEIAVRLQVRIAVRLRVEIAVWEKVARLSVRIVVQLRVGMAVLQCRVPPITDPAREDQLQRKLMTRIAPKWSERLGAMEWGEIEGM